MGFFWNNIVWSCFTIHKGNPTGLVIAETKDPLQQSAAKLHGKKGVWNARSLSLILLFYDLIGLTLYQTLGSGFREPSLASRSAHSHSWWGGGSIKERGNHNTIRQRASSEECSLHGQFTANCCEAYLTTTKPVADMLQLVKPITNIKLYDMWIAVITLSVPPQY